ncbi:MAG: ROK family protein [Pyrinomonadaceae bacterium]
MKKSVTAGIDIGGTKIALALENPAGERVASRRVPTQADLGPDRVLSNIHRALEEMLAETQTEPVAVGLVSPGPIDIERGLVLSPTNLPNWDEFPIVELVEKKLGVPVIFDNDANAAALGEYFEGAGRGFRDIFYVTISTGIGGAIILDGQLYHGVGAGAGEFGHSIVDPDGIICGCGTRGCLETIASGRNIARRTREKLARSDGNSLICQLVAGPDEITTQAVVEAVRANDPVATEVWNETVFYLAVGIGNAITILAPEAVVIGGGVTAVGDLLFEPLGKQITKNVNNAPIEKIKILKASLGSQSGVFGALRMARQGLQKRGVHFDANRIIGV